MIVKLNIPAEIMAELHPNSEKELAQFIAPLLGTVDEDGNPAIEIPVKYALRFEKEEVNWDRVGILTIEFQSGRVEELTLWGLLDSSWN